MIDMLGLSRAMAEASPMPMAELDGAKHIVGYANPPFCRLAGKTKEELLGERFFRR